ncbi:unnamed protein product [Urochloa decumbens]|uniref:Uncharacterized protein n=1 Tax=Urochloa decumbens TaxID=240449 RepID=A0ABC9GU22_9POAL
MTATCWGWEAVAVDGELSPEVGALLASERGRRELSCLLRSRDEALRSKVRKHLVALGWRIVAKRNAAMAPRLQYLRPPNCNLSKTSYCSLPDLIRVLAFSDDAAIAAAGGNGNQQQQEEEQQPPESSSDSDSDPPPPPPPPGAKDAIGEYVAFMASGGSNINSSRAAAERLRAQAKRQLEASGWTLWTKLRSDGREELRYKAPTTFGGRSYMSLHTACQASQQSSSSVVVLPSSSTRRKKRKISELLLTTTCAGAAVVKKCTTTTIEKKKRKRTCLQLQAVGGCVIKKRSTTTTTTTVKRSSKKKKQQQKKRAASAAPRVVLRPTLTNGGDDGCAYWRSRTLVSVLMEEGILVARDKVTCNGRVGLVTGDGVIRCTCCGKAFTVAEFEAHHSHSRPIASPSPWARVFLNKDGRSLSQCLVELMRRDDGDHCYCSSTKTMMRMKQACLDPAGDSVCSICNDGGDLLLCDHCPAAYHRDCLGPRGGAAGDDEDDHWFCPCCRCAACGGTDFDPASDGDAVTTDRSVIYCEQCEREYHVGCAVELHQLQVQEPWLCSPGCAKVFRHLQGLAGTSIPTSTPGVSLVILRRRRRRPQQQQQQEEHTNQQEQQEALAHGKLRAALDVLHECFVPLVEPRTQTDLAADIVFNRESQLRRLHFRGYHVVGLDKGGELVTAATLRVYGNSVAELPLVGTRFAHRRQGMLRLLMTELERMLRHQDMGVQRLLLPAVPDLLHMWKSLGFSPMTHSDRLLHHAHTILCFQGTTMCQKTLLPPAA